MKYKSTKRKRTMNIIFSGGLGNQMFQYALYLRLKLAGKNVRMSTSLYYLIQMHNGYELNEIFDTVTPAIQFSKLYLFWIRFLYKYRLKWFVYSDSLKYDDTVFITKKPYLIGYWQSEKYFIQIKEQVLNTFVFKNIDEKNHRIAKEMQNLNSISMHIRRGDYVGNAMHDGVYTLEYYRKAIDTILTIIKEARFYVFSDDSRWAQDFIKTLPIQAFVINWNKGRNSYKDMYLMSQCKHNIIANSTFSWWGAWLNKNPQKTVIAPAKWFPNTPSESYKDIILDKWIKI
jgi:hypothetical protein